MHISRHKGHNDLHRIIQYYDPASQKPLFYEPFTTVMTSICLYSTSYDINVLTHNHKRHCMSSMFFFS